MNLTFINFNAEISGEGSRVLAAILRRQGHRVRMIFTPNIGSHPIQVHDDDWLSEFGDTQVYLFSFMSPYLVWAIHVTDFLKRVQPGVPIVWGGVHPSAMPEDSIRYVDYLGRMECEEALPEFLERMDAGEDLTQVKNFWVRTPSGEIARNPLRPPIHDLDSIPPPEYRLEEEYVLHEGRLVHMTPELLARYHTTYYFGKPTYLALTTRGCPYMCTYCYNSQLVRSYKSRKIRYRDLVRVIHEEIKPALERFPFFRTVGLTDDDFFHIDKDTLRRFCDEWKKEVNLPFAAATRPASCDPEKVEMLVDAGLAVVQMGIQSGSEKLNREVYKRPASNKRVLRAIEVMEPYVKQGRLQVNVDFILDNPYETDEDILKTIQLFRKFPKEIWSNLFSLAFYPGTALYDRARKDGIISDSYEEFSRAFNIQTARSHRYLTYVFLLQNALRDKLPSFALDLLASRPARFVGNHLPKFLLDGLWGRKIFPKIAGKHGILLP